VASPESLKDLLASLIDYAGLYPPASLPLPAVIENYQAYLHCPQNWILNRLVLPASKLPEVSLATDWRVTLIVEDEPGPLPPQIETLETRGTRGLSLPTYCEAPIDAITAAFAKIRTANVSTEELASFLEAAAARRIAFKATAGLHHALRSDAGLGFLNVFVAACFAWNGMDRADLVRVLEDSDSHPFSFADDGLRWREHRLTTPQVRAARSDFAHSFGSCSFEEPIDGLRELGLLP
jgi:hypothetical protein